MDARPVRLLAVLTILASAACSRGATDSRVTAAPSPPASVAAPASAGSGGRSDRAAPSLPLEQEALAMVEALPAIRAWTSNALPHGSKHALRTAVRVVAAPERRDGGGESWLVAVGSPDIFLADGRIAGGYEPEFWVRVAGKDRLTIASGGRALEELKFRDYADWAARESRQARLESLVRSTPEWEAHAREIARTPAPLAGERAALGLLCDFAPDGCKLDDAACRLRCDAMRICSGCAGRWLTLSIGAADETVHLTDEDSDRELPYGEWRNRFRTHAREHPSADSRGLADPRQAFPDYRGGQAEFGYGAPESDSSSLPAAAVAALSRGGFTLVRVERYGASGFPLLVLDGKTSLPPARFRAWGGELVHALGDCACEISIAGADRYQFDRFALGKGSGGVYRFVEDGFHPWLANVP